MKVLLRRLSGAFDASIIEAVVEHLEQPHKALKSQLLEQTPRLLLKLKESGIKADLTPISHKKARLAALFATKGDPRALHMLGQIYKSLEGASVNKVIARDNLFIGMCLLNGCFLMVNERILPAIEKDPLSAPELLYHIGILKSSGVWTDNDQDILTTDKIKTAIDEAYIKGFNQVLKLDFPIETIRSLFKKWGRFDQLFGIATGLLSSGLKEQHKKLGEAVSMVVEGRFHDWRRSNGTVPYLNENQDFWDNWLVNNRTKLENLDISFGMTDKLVPLLNDITKILETTDIVTRFLPSKFANIWQAFVKSNNKDKFIKTISGERIVLSTLKGKLYHKQLITKDHNELLSLMNKYSIKPDLQTIENIEGTIKSIDALQKFMKLYMNIQWFMPTQEWADASLRSLSEIDDYISKMLYSLHFNRVPEEKSFRSKLEVLHQAISNNSKKIESNDIEILDTDDPKLILESGAFDPVMSNCMHFLGDPSKNKSLIDSLGSKNKKLVLVKVNGEIRSAATIKLRKDSNGAPVIFIEKPLHREGYSFLNEMVEFLQKKAYLMGAGTRVAIQTNNANQIRDLGNFEQSLEVVHGTGNFSIEYLEAVFHDGNSSNISHKALILKKSLR